MARTRRPNARGDMWCSFGKHRSYVLPDLVYQYAGASICIKCQLEVADNLRIESKRKQVDPGSTGLVYYMGINGQIKIGYTTNLRQRSSAYPPGTELLAVEPGTPELEKQRHNQFSRHLARGREWFADNPALTAHIDACAQAFGVPTSLMHNLRKHEGAKQQP